MANETEMSAALWALRLGKDFTFFTYIGYKLHSEKIGYFYWKLRNFVFLVLENSVDKFVQMLNKAGFGLR